MTDYIITYITMEVGFIAIVLFLAARMTQNVGTMREIRHFRLIQVFFVAEAVVQILWVLDDGDQLPLPIWAAWVVSLIYVLAFCFCMYEWFLFTTAKVRGIVPEKILRFTTAVQTVLVCLHIFLIFASPWKQWIFYIDADGHYVRGELFWINAVLCYSHWFMAAVLLTYGMKKVSRSMEQHLAKILLVSLVPSIGGALQAVFYRIPFLDLAMTLATLFLFTVLQEKQVLTDALTGLKNRAQFDYDLERKLGRAENEPFYLFVTDIDRFKSINDTYGHLQGDRALQLIAIGFRTLSEGYASLKSYRYGGDEFVLLVNEKDVEDPAAFVDAINETIMQAQVQEGLGFSVRVSAGYQLASSNEDGKKFFQRADDMLYAVKKTRR